MVLVELLAVLVGRVGVGVGEGDVEHLAGLSDLETKEEVGEVDQHYGSEDVGELRGKNEGVRHGGGVVGSNEYIRIYFCFQKRR